MKGSRKVVIYELHNKSIVIQPTKIGRSGKFAIMSDGKTYNNISDTHLGKEIRKWLNKSKWSEKK